MIIRLMHRTYGVHSPIKQKEIPGTLRRYAKKSNKPENANRVGKFYDINEERLLAALPKNFLPVEPKLCLITVADGSGSTAQSGFKIFRNWGKYFSSYVIELNFKEPKNKKAKLKTKSNG